MNKNDFKQSIDCVKPDEYMKTRLAAKVTAAEPNKKPHKKLFRIAIGALCIAVAVTAFSVGGVLNSHKSDNENLFVMCVNAAEPEEEKNYKPIDKEKIVISNHQLSWEQQEGAWVLCENNPYDGDFTVNGENIEYVKYSCKTGNLVVYNNNLGDYLYKNEKMFDIIVPKEVGDKMNLSSLQGEEIDEMVKSGVFKKYFGDKTPAKNGYREFWEIFETDNLPYCKEGYGLVSNDTYKKLYPYTASAGNGMKEYTFKNVMNYTEGIAYSGWSPDTSGVKYDGQNHFSVIPQDVLTLEITFKDGSKQMAEYALSFTDEGALVIEQQK